MDKEQLESHPLVRKTAHGYQAAGALGIIVPCRTLEDAHKELRFTIRANTAVFAAMVIAFTSPIVALAALLLLKA